MTRPGPHDAAPTDEEVDALIAKAAELLDELRDTFAEIKNVLAGREGAP